MPNSRQQVCAICGVREASTRDHVPPKNLFPEPRPSDLITVPACCECNNGSSVEDEDFRTYLALQIGKQSDIADKLWLSSKRSLDRRTRMRREFLKSLATATILTPAGPVQRTAFAIPCRVYDVVFERVVRGLYLHHFGSILGPDVKVEVEPLIGIDNNSYKLIAGFPTYSIGGTAFVYKYALAAEDSRVSTWVFQLYESHWILGQTGSNL